MAESALLGELNLEYSKSSNWCGGVGILFFLRLNMYMLGCPCD